MAGPLNLLRTCRQFRTEALGIFYGETTFTLGVALLEHDEDSITEVDDFKLE
ncbi:hypothetical protein Slin15195_G073690 [Septoria linicola]|uniref:Uncharacterized protein n=1 Tax=Septoria linicola TaxID=215465 RepID=A0A9Q9AS07_9PEZI|nr:hypothetical protein Slin15195_G073690 [Septoria linicola]